MAKENYLLDFEDVLNNEDTLLDRVSSSAGMESSISPKGKESVVPPQPLKSAEDKIETPIEVPNNTRFSVNDAPVEKRGRAKKEKQAVHSDNDSSSVSSVLFRIDTELFVQLRIKLFMERKSISCFFRESVEDYLKKK